MSHVTEHVPRILLVVATLCATPVVASPPAEIPLWSNGAPGSEGKSAKEDVTTSASGELRVAGIHNPTMTPYLPAEATATGLAILVIPGGGHRMLAITHEGYNVAEWLQAHGIAAFVLKHGWRESPTRHTKSRSSRWPIRSARCG